MQKIAIYGKGGIGKSTIASNISAALSDKGLIVMQIGCDPKSDSTRLLMHGEKIPTVLSKLQTGSINEPGDIVYRGYNSVACVESGGPTPGIGCAGRGIVTAFEALERAGAYEDIKPDVIIYDVLGDVVCGGFAMPIRGGYADKVFVVTSGEMMALYAAENIIEAVRNFSKRKYAGFGGLILNCRNIEDEKKKVEEFAEEANVEIVGTIPRDNMVQDAELQGKTVIEAFPDSPLAGKYRNLAMKILEVCKQ